MPWFKVDDTLFTHPKVTKAGNRAIGLWVRAGSWSMSLLTDGFVPKHMIPTLGASTADARKLVDAGLWATARQDGEDGYRFHQWLERQPSREQVEADRAAARERQQRAREAAKAKRAARDAADRSGSLTPV